MITMGARGSAAFDSAMRSLLSTGALDARALLQSSHAGWCRRATPVKSDARAARMGGRGPTRGATAGTQTMSIPPGASPKAMPEAWEPTRAQTQFARDEEAYLDTEPKE